MCLFYFVFLLFHDGERRQREAHTAPPAKRETALQFNKAVIIIGGGDEADFEATDEPSG